MVVVDDKLESYWQKLYEDSLIMNTSQAFTKFLSTQLQKLYRFVHESNYVFKWDVIDARLNGFPVKLITGAVYVATWWSKEEQRFGGIVPLGRGNAIIFGESGRCYVFDIKGDDIRVDAEALLMVVPVDMLDTVAETVVDNADTMVFSFYPFFSRRVMGKGRIIVSENEVLLIFYAKYMPQGYIIYRFYGGAKR